MSILSLVLDVINELNKYFSDMKIDIHKKHNDKESNLLSLNDIIIEVQKTSVKNSSDLKRKVEGIFKKGEKTLLLTIINKDNRRRYLGVKIN